MSEIEKQLTTVDSAQSEDGVVKHFTVQLSSG